MTLFTLCGAALITASVGLVLRQSREPGAAPVLTAAGILFMTALLLPRLREAVDTVSRLLAAGGMGACGALMLKALGVGFVVQLGCDLCRGLGEEPIAGILETAGKIEILLLCLPLFGELLDLMREILP